MPGLRNTQSRLGPVHMNKNVPYTENVTKKLPKGRLFVK